MARTRFLRVPLMRLLPAELPSFLFFLAVEFRGCIVAFDAFANSTPVST